MKIKKSQNSQNPRRGREFEEKVAQILSEKYGMEFKKLPIRIGHPPKEHEFDLVSQDKKYVIECKCYTWKKNVPAAKMAILNEAVFYLSHLSNKYRWIVMKKDFSKRKKKTLAQYYFLTNRHLLDGVKIWEVDENDHIRKIS